MNKLIAIINMNKLIAIINNISIVDHQSCILKTTKNKYYVIYLIGPGNVWRPVAGEIFKNCLKQSELFLWGTDDLKTFSIRYFLSGKEISVINSDNAEIKEISSGKALTLLLKE